MDERLLSVALVLMRESCVCSVRCVVYECVIVHYTLWSKIHTHLHTFTNAWWSSWSYTIDDDSGIIVPWQHSQITLYIHAPHT